MLSISSMSRKYSFAGLNARSRALLGLLIFSADLILLGPLRPRPFVTWMNCHTFVKLETSRLPSTIISRIWCWFGWTWGFITSQVPMRPLRFGWIEISLGLVGDPYPPSGASFLAPRLRGIVDGLVLMAIYLSVQEFLPIL